MSSLNFVNKRLLLRRKQRLLEKCIRKQKRKQKLLVHQILGKVHQCVDEFDYDLAVKLCRKALHLSPDDIRVLETAGMIMLEAGLVDESYKISSYYKLDMTCGEEAVTYLQKGIEIMTREQSKKKDLTNTSKSSVELSRAYCSLAEIYLTDECFSENADELCYKYCQKAIECCPSNPEAYQTTANYLLSKSNNEEACSLLLQGISLWLPDQLENEEEKDSQLIGGVETPSYYSRITCAKLLIEVEQYEKAQQVLEGLIKDDDEVLGVWYLMGWCHFLTSNFSLSKNSLNKVIKLYKKLDCDEKEMFDHSQQLLQDIDSKISLQVEGPV